MRKILAAAAVFGLMACACGKRMTPNTKLKAAVQSAHFKAPCDALIPMEWPSSLPVPAGSAGVQEFKVFFYPLGRPGTPGFVGAPLGEAVLRLDGSVASCQRLPGAGQGLSAKRWPEAAAALGVDGLGRSLDQLSRPPKRRPPSMRPSPRPRRRPKRPCRTTAAGS